MSIKVRILIRLTLVEMKFPKGNKYNYLPFNNDHTSIEK